MKEKEGSKKGSAEQSRVTTPQGRYELLNHQTSEKMGTGKIHHK